MQRRLLDRFGNAPLTYGQIGATATALPSGFQHDHRHEVIGRGRQHFAGASETLQSWQMHRRAGLIVAASGPVAQPDALVVLGLGIRPIRLWAPCRVVYTVDEERRRGFAYGTLRGHPASGEESFVVELHDDGRVSFTVTAFSRPARWFSRLGGPLTRQAQRFVTGRYVRALY